MYQLPTISVRDGLIAILDRDVHRPLLGIIQQLHAGRKRRTLNLMHPGVMERIRLEPGLLPHQASIRDIEAGIAKLVSIGAIAVENWNGNGRVPKLSGTSYRVFPF